MNAAWRIVTPHTDAGSALAIIEATGDVDALLERTGIGAVPVGEVKLRNLLGVDTGLVARWSQSCAHLMPHGGPFIVRRLGEALQAAGVPRAGAEVPLAPRYPEARDEIEARMLDTLASAASPLANDLLLDQPRRWREPCAQSDPNRDRILRRLLEPPLVVALGPPNIGKSTLLDTLAGRQIALVADQPGTTRDHVGVHLNLAGLVVRYVDTPGLSQACDPLVSDAAAIALDLALSADLILLCGDSTAPPPAIDPCGSAITIALRADLGPPAFPAALALSARRGTGLRELTDLLRDALVPPAALTDPRPWQFWT